MENYAESVERIVTLYLSYCVMVKSCFFVLDLDVKPKALVVRILLEEFYPAFRVLCVDYIELCALAPSPFSRS
ncbi:hypothetical protein [Argonema galeatum]|uniref:hypothetical protein n=1 Tax=Argonema galeatum TaxID=2942762 RepID=UPI0020126D54|nr:hypothetical protein [Argonema galeatum]MCL1468744.1 hypothetical protein [Argonema galeatum A003/A1]